MRTLPYLSAILVIQIWLCGWQPAESHGQKPTENELRAELKELMKERRDSAVFGLLQDRQRIRNQETHVSLLRAALKQFESLYNAQRIDYLQVLQVRGDLYREQCVLLDLKTSYNTTLDAFKTQPGLPPSLKVEIEDSMINAFNLVDDAMAEPPDRLASLQRQLGQAVVAIIHEIPEDSAAPPWSDKLAQRLQNLKRIVTEADTLRKSILSVNIPRARNDIESLQKNLETRVQTLDRLRDKVQQAVEEGAAPDIEPTVLDSSRIKQLPGKLKRLLVALEKQFGNLQESMEASKSAIDELLANGKTMEPKRILTTLRTEIFEKIPDQIGDVSALMLELTLIQAQARTEGVDLIPIEMTSATNTARNVELNQLNFEVRRQVVLNSINEVLSARCRLQEPPRPDQQPGASQQLGATTARELVSALNNLRDAQNDFMNTWVTYEKLRRSLDSNRPTIPTE